ncbi:MAG: hypothetical protein IKF45_06675 [Lachnospiraceae bacterium]|nr:hypothetical protein [Lachnospiraceae bacterium]MBR2996379.1 hypothetical protein [Lachnospiraceae bacterium]
MKKKLVAAMIAVFAMTSVLGMTVCASEVPEEQNVVEMVEYDENMDEFASEMVIEWSDGTTTFRRIIKPAPKKQEPAQQEVITASATWYDAAGNKYVLDGASHTVTIYDADGNVIDVRPQ